MEFILENYTELIQSQDWMNFFKAKKFCTNNNLCVVCM